MSIFLSMRDPQSESLFIAPSCLGDTILSTCAIRHVIEASPHTQFTVVTPPFMESFFKSMPFCRRILTLTKQSYARHWITVWNQTKHSNWDSIIDMRGSCVSMFLRARTRHIWSKIYEKQTYIPYDIHQYRVYHQHKVISIHRMLRRQTLLSPRVWLDEATLQTARFHIQTPTFALAPLANWVGKQWPQKHIVELMHIFLKNTDTSHKILLIAAPHESETLQEIYSFFSNTPYFSRIQILLSADLSYVAANLSLCRAFLGNDSGLMHMAAALNIPVIALFGPTDERRYAPFSADSYIIRGARSYDAIRTSSGFRADSSQCYMHDISVTQVWRILRTCIHKLI